MKGPFLWHLSASQWGRFGGGVVFLAVLGGLLIWPEARRVRELHRQREELQERIQTQEMLYPLYQAHLMEIQRLKQYQVFPVPEPKKGGLPTVREAIANIRDRVRAQGFSLLLLSPDMTVFNPEEDRMALEVRMSGSFPQVRELLLALGRLSYVVHLEHLEVRENPDTGETIDLRLWLVRG